MIFAFTMALINAPRVQGEDAKDVRVVNAADHPVPTQAQGTTTVAGIVSIDPKNNTIGLAPGSTVCIDPSCGSVPVKNDEQTILLTRDVDNPARQPFMQSGQTHLFPGQHSADSGPFPPVPAGKILVIEHAAVLVEIPLGQGPTVSFRITGFPAHLVLSKQRSEGTLFDGFDTFTASQPIKLYVRPGETLVCRLDRGTASGGFATADFGVSGHFVDVP